MYISNTEKNTLLYLQNLIYVKYVKYCYYAYKVEKIKENPVQNKAYLQYNVDLMETHKNWIYKLFKTYKSKINDMTYKCIYVHESYIKFYDLLEDLYFY